ncbi:MAG: hypothetical protein B1H12_08435 [Desulfobacteraceae bacterium 4484_190.2]|nr:MAG: hypothetical protein B1H12_08435 [Desulfobacteraceae bacterium 4484_190.2]
MGIQAIVSQSINLGGNEYSEAIFINALTDQMAPADYAYLHHLAETGLGLEPRRYDWNVITRQDAAGMPFEWNEVKPFGSNVVL